MRVLVVGDDEVFRAKCRSALRARGVQVYSDDGVGALQRIPAENFDAAIIDVLMPVVDGLEVIIAARRYSPTTKLYAVSGGGSISVAECLGMAQKMGADLCLEKPVEFDDLAQTIIRGRRRAELF